MKSFCKNAKIIKKFKKVRPITPPPESPPQHRNPNKARSNRHTSRSDGDNSSVTSSSRIETTVAQVVEEAAEYARRFDEVNYEKLFYWVFSENWLHIKFWKVEINI